MKKLFSFFLLLTLLTTPISSQLAPPDKGLDSFLEELIKEMESEEAKKKKPIPQKPVALEEEKEEEVEGKKDMRTLFLESLKAEQKKLPRAKKQALYYYMQELTATIGKISQKISSLDAYNRGKFTSYIPLLNDVEILLGELLAEEEHLKSLAAAENESFRQQILNLLLPELQNLNREIEVESERPSLGPIVLALASRTLLVQNGPIAITTSGKKEESFFQKYVQDPSSKVLDGLTRAWEYLKSWFVTPEKPAPKPKKVVTPKPQEEEVAPVERPAITQPEIIRKRELSKREKRLEELVQIKYSTLTKMALRKLREFFDMSLMSLKSNLEKVVKFSAKAIEEKRQEREAKIKKAEEQKALLEKQAGMQRPPAYTSPRWPAAGAYPPSPFSPGWPGASPGGRRWWRRPGASPTTRSTTSKTTKPSKTGTTAGEEEKEEEKALGGAVGKDNPLTQEQKLKETIIYRVAEVKKRIKEGDTLTAQSIIREIERHEQELERVLEKLKTLSAYQAKKREKKWQEKDREYQEALKELEEYRKKVGAPKSVSGETSKLQAKLRVKELEDKLDKTAKGLLEEDTKILALQNVQASLTAHLAPNAGTPTETLLNNIRDLRNQAYYTTAPRSLSVPEAKAAVLGQLDKVANLIRDLPKEGWEHLRRVAATPTTPAPQKEVIKTLQKLDSMLREKVSLIP